MGIWKYFEDRERELRECSLNIPDGVELFAAEDDEQRGKIYGRLLFAGYPPSVYLMVHEDVVARGAGFTRPRYAYFLVIDGREIGGYERHRPTIRLSTSIARATRTTSRRRRASCPSRTLSERRGST